MVSWVVQNNEKVPKVNSSRNQHISIVQNLAYKTLQVTDLQRFMLFLLLV